MEKIPKMFESSDSSCKVKISPEYEKTIINNYGPIKSIELISETTNLVYCIRTENKKLVLKILRPERKSSEDLDIDVIKKTGNKFFKKVFLNKNINGNQVLITEYIEGILLKDSLYNQDIDTKSIYSQIEEFFKSIEKIKISNCGDVNGSFTGSDTDWNIFSLEKIETYKRTIGPAIDKNYFDFLSKECSNVSIEKPVLIPVDINLSNFIVDKEKRLRILDVGSYFSGDHLLPWGILLGNAWNTELGRTIIEKNKNSENRLYLYAAIEMLAIISYSLKFKITDLDHLRPFGNKLLAKKILSDTIKSLDQLKQKSIDTN